MVAPTSNVLVPTLPVLRDEFDDDGCSSSKSTSQLRRRSLSPLRSLSSLSTTESLSSLKTTMKMNQTTTTTSTDEKERVSSSSSSSPSNTSNNDRNPANANANANAKSSSSWDEEDKNDSDKNSSLESRVAELEEKLTSLSRLLLTVTKATKATKAAPTTTSTTTTTKSRPSMSSLFEEDSPELSPIQSTAPYLESPCLSRSLSHRMLREESQSPSLTNIQCPRFEMNMEDNIVHNIVLPNQPDDHFFTQKQQQQQQQQQQQRRTVISSTKEKVIVLNGEKGTEPEQKGKPSERVIEITSTEPHSEQEQPPPKKTVQQKWMDYLECFQEPKPDVDNQMEEFVKVPSQLEGLLTFGLIICFDSFLYFLTMLPIKFIWSTFLLLKSTFSKDENYTFHRR